MSEHVAQRQSSELLWLLPPARRRAGIILTTLIVVAAVANLPLAMANVALPSIGSFFNATQTQLNLVAVSYSLGLACSVLWFGALGDRNGRKLMLILGVSLAMPAALVCGFAPSIQILIAGRLVGGFAAGMAFPTTLSLIAALWGPVRPAPTPSHCGPRFGGAINASGPLISGLLLTVFSELHLLRDPAAGRGRAHHGRALCTWPRPRDQRTGGQPGRFPVADPRRLVHLGHQLRAGARAADVGARLGRHRRGRLGGLCHPATAHRQPAL
ncbi:MAG: MFS transporter [Caldilineaceae bacterium]